MLRRTLGPLDEAVYEIEMNGRTVRMSAREFCQLACEVETFFREGRDQVIDDVCHETARDEASRDLSPREGDSEIPVHVARN